MNRILRYAPTTLFFTILLLTVFYLVHHQITSLDRFASDTDEHIIILYRLFYEPGYYISHPLWHTVTFYLSRFFHISIENSAALSSAFFVTLWAWLVYRITRRETGKNTPLLPLGITAIVITVGPLCLPWIRKIIFLGSPNIWHNVTLWAVKPLALLTVWFLLLALREKEWKYYLYSLGAALLSIFAKPSFIIVFIPALLLFIPIKKLFSRTFLTYLTLLLLTSSLVLFYQYTHTFGSHGNSKIIIDFLGVWSRSTPNVAYSILMLLAFPLAFSLLESRIVHDDAIMLSWLMVFFGIAYYATFAQTGRFYTHGNFGWSYMIATSLLYFFTILKFVKIFYDITLWKRALLSGLLSIQTAIGLYYLWKVLEGQNPLYIAIFL